MANGLNNSNLKSSNRGLMLQLIAAGKQPSRIELARQSNLTKMAVSKIVTNLIDDGLVEETGIEETNNVGRNPIGLGISSRAPKIVGLLIDRKYCMAILCDLRMKILLLERLDLDESCNSTSLQKTIYTLLGKIFRSPQADTVLGIGVGTPGPVDINNGIILNPPNFYGITNFPVGSILRRKYDLPVLVDNQCNTAAVVERFFGVGKYFLDFVYVGITTGIGSGIITNGQLLQNFNGLSSEIGHLSINYDGPVCTCGNRGCLEAYIGTPVLSKTIEELTGERLSFRELCERDGTSPYTELFEDMIEKLGSALTSCINLLNPQAVVLGHESYWLSDMRTNQLEQLLNARKISQTYRHIEVIKPFFAEQTTVLGCASSIAALVFSGQLLSGK
ncbi:ROK family transcriptional regulator [Breznakiella homolactica]|uniref:ROK family transcriptional regulator n=1 Tax=Breznakiella homolactica TaxID=2798577 RepID=A0A7T7XNE3_9SPIR|nr:ROK family transcriptional regulator [Breznakiella homolactica]QQO09549.1 ROK family transcriptional regulator [Breznakiella homolactica]